MLREYHLSRTGISLLFFATGCSSLLFQTILIRESLVVMYGTELVLGTILGIWLAGIGLGAAWGSRERLSSHFLPFLFICLTIVPVPIISLLKLTRLLLPSVSGEYLSFLPFALFLLVLTLPFTALVGLLFPLGCQAISLSLPGAKGIGRIYAWESLGALTAGIIFTYFLLGWCKPLAMLGSAVIFNTVILAGVFPPARKYLIISLPPLLLAVAALPSLDRRLERANWKYVHPSTALLEVAETPYAHFNLARYRDQITLYQNGQPHLSYPDPRVSSRRSAFFLSQHPHPQTVLLIENGTGGMIQSTLKSALERLDYLERDRESYSLILPHLTPEDRSLLEDRRLRVIFADGRDYLNSSPCRYDAVFLNLPSPVNASGNRFFTREFFLSVRERLEAGGVFGFSLRASENYLGGDTFQLVRSIFATLRQVFPEVIVSPGDDAFFFASPSPGTLSSDPVTLRSRFSRFTRALPSFVPEEFGILFPPERTAELQDVLVGNPAPRNTDSRPVTYFQNLLLWDRFSDSHLRPLILALRGKGLYLFLLVLAGASLLLFLPSRKAYSCPVVIFLLGFCLMGISVAWLYTFQNLFGTLYRAVGIINAMFMLGLAAGSVAFSLRPPRSGVSVFLLAGTLLTTAGIALLLPRIPALFYSSFPLFSPSLKKGFILTGMFLTGFCGGSAFPLASHLALSVPGRTARWTGGMLDSADHFGAAAGGFLGGPFLLPVLGIERSALLWTGLLFLAILLALLTWTLSTRKR